MNRTNTRIGSASGFGSGSCSVRLALPEDATTICRFIRELATYEREPDAVKITADQLAEQMAATPPALECLLAELDGVPVGFALFHQNYSTWAGRPGLYLEDLYVRQEHRSSGVGRAIFQSLQEIARDRNYGRIEWQVLNWNTTAQKFYSAIGASPLTEWTKWRLEPSGSCSA